VLVDAWLPRAAAEKPLAVAVNNLKYGDLLREAQRAARQLSALGVVAGERVALTLVPGEQFAIYLHAIWLLGAVAVPIDPSTPPDQVAVRTAELAVTVSGVLDGHEDPAVQLATSHDLDAAAVVIYSSGSSGAAKAIELSFGNFWWSAAGSAVALGLDPTERWLCCLPLSHVGGLSILVRAAIYGTGVIVHERFELGAVLSQLSDPDGPTLVSLVPTTLQRLLDSGLREPPRLRWVLLGGGPISEQLLERAEGASVAVAASYGMSEACSQIVTRGAPLFCTRVALSESDEILVRGPTVARQCQPILSTGDLGRWDAAGELELVGRSSDLIISGGENVAPEAVEAVLAQHPAVADVAVVGRKDAEWGEVVTAIVVIEDGEVASAGQLIDFCQPLLSPFQRPKRIEFRESLGRSSAGKLRRKEL
jgi:o-succinylbenzoate---CoA ligase